MYQRLRTDLAANQFPYDPYNYQDPVMVSALEVMASRNSGKHHMEISREDMLFEIQHFKSRPGSTLTSSLFNHSE